MTLAGGATFMACNKEENTVATTKSNFAKSGEKPISIEEEIKQIIDNLNVLLKDNQNVVIATYSKGKDFELAFEKTKFFELYEKAIKEDVGDEIVVNDIYIVDENPYIKDYQPCIAISTFDLNTSKTATSFHQLRKIVDEKGTTFYFYPISCAASTSSSMKVTCEGKNCKNTGGCSPVRDGDGHLLGGCTPCEDGECKAVTTAEEITIEKSFWEYFSNMVKFTLGLNLGFTKPF